MGMMIFDLPARMPEDAQAALEHASIAGGQDAMPYPTQVLIDQGRMILSRQVDDSGSVLAPWSVNGAGRVMVASGTLIERLNPYLLTLELARGKINQVRSQESDWRMSGLCVPDSLAQAIRNSTLAFSKAVALNPDPRAGEEAQSALHQGFEAADQLAHVYSKQVLEIRHLRQPRLDTTLSCRLAPGAIAPDARANFVMAFNTVSVPFCWADIEAEPECFRWDEYDKLVNWAAGLGLPIIGGPLADFSGCGLPHWLWEQDADLTGLCGYMADFMERAIERYRGAIRTWQITAASNWGGVIALADDELLWLTVRLGELVRRLDSSLEIVVGLAQPWGDYLTRQERCQSPFAFADNLMRTGLKVAALDLEVIMGVEPRGSYCRDLLDLSRMLDLYAVLGMPLQVTLGYPSGTAVDARADADQQARAGHWRAGFTPDVQAEWAASFARLCVCKPYVRGVQWVHFSDAHAHTFPHCGLLDANGMAKPALRKLAELRAEHLR